MLIHVQDTIDLAWNSGLVTPFASFRDWRNWEGMSTFLYICKTHTGSSVDILKYLINLGANIHDRSSTGETCLHLLMYGNPSGQAVTLLFDCFAYLLQEGADPYAQDNGGKTASDMAYNPAGHGYVVDGVLGDIWDAALHVSGFDISPFRRIQRRRPRYSRFYTRQDFEELWRGKEDQCPYWDDKPWPPLEAGEEDSDPDSDHPSYGCVSDFDMSDDEVFSEDDDDEGEDGGALL